jgi:hypothetical protein
MNLSSEIATAELIQKWKKSLGGSDKDKQVHRIVTYVAVNTVMLRVAAVVRVFTKHDPHDNDNDEAESPFYLRSE